jgi:hypothetical protein
MPWWKELDDLVQHGRRAGVLAREDKLPPSLEELRMQYKQTLQSEPLRANMIKAFRVCFHPDWVCRRYRGDNKEQAAEIATDILSRVTLELSDRAYFSLRVQGLESCIEIIKNAKPIFDDPPSPKKKTPVDPVDIALNKYEEWKKQEPERRKKEKMEVEQLVKEFERKRRVPVGPEQPPVKRNPAWR